MINNWVAEKRFNSVYNSTTLFSVYFLVYYCISGYFFANKNIFLIFICMLIITYELFLLRKKNLNKDSFVIAIFIFPFFGFLSSLFNSDSMIFSNISQMISLIFLYMSIVLFIGNEKRKMIKLVTIVFWTGFVGGPIIGLYQMLRKEYLYTLPLDSVYKENSFIDTIISTATQYNANLVALQIAVTLFLGIFLKEYKYVKSKLFNLVILILIISLCFTMSRTTIICTIVVLAFYYFKKIKKMTFNKFVKNYFASLIILIISIITLKYLGDTLYEALDLERVIKIKSVENADIRILQWKGVVEVITTSNISNFILGYGYNYISILGNITGYSISTHNTFLEQLIKNGVFSFIISIYIYVLFLKNNFIVQSKDDRYLPIFLGGIVVVISLQMISSIGIDSLLLPMIFAKQVLQTDCQKEKREVNEN